MPQPCLLKFYFLILNQIRKITSGRSLVQRNTIKYVFCLPESVTSFSISAYARNSTPEMKKEKDDEKLISKCKKIAKEITTIVGFIL